MIQYTGIDISEGIDFDEANNSLEWMICHC